MTEPKAPRKGKTRRRNDSRRTPARSKHTASGARREGDQYQDLLSAETLISWLEQPANYHWVRLEAMDGSLDDIQVCNADDSLGLYQVKFGVDPADVWTWDDLLEQKPGQSKAPNQTLKPSLLMKWAASLESARRSASVSVAALKTNQACAQDVREALSKGKVAYEQVDATTRDRIASQLGGIDKATAFFSEFLFQFSEPSPDALADALRMRFARLGGTSEGWHSLIDNIKRWINRQQEPTPDGKIELHHVRAAARWHQPASIPQDFVIPPDYVAPKSWSAEYVESRIRNSIGETIVVTGSPGAGKSTYMSWLVGHLKAAGANATDSGAPNPHIVLRHHFFLSLADSTPGRSQWQVAANSLMSQLHDQCPSMHLESASQTPDKLRVTLERALATNGCHRIVVIVDGLDHVWRDTGSSDELRELFDLLLPPPDRVTLIVGTQQLEPTRLPQKLRQAAPLETWLSIPHLTEIEVGHWLEFHRDTLDIAEQPWLGNQLATYAQMFHRVSGGHPLVLHYTYAAARSKKCPIEVAEVEAMGTFEPTANLTSYYQTLWDAVLPIGKTLLHLVAGFPWPWPANGIARCLASAYTPDQLSQAELSVRHLMGTSPLGTTAFHERKLSTSVRHLRGVN